MFYALEHIFGRQVADRKGRPFCEVYLFETEDDRAQWVQEDRERREAVGMDHPIVVSLLGESPVFALETPWVQEEALR